MHWVGLTETLKLIPCRITWRSGEFAFGIKHSLVTFRGQISMERGRDGKMSKALTTL